MALGWIRSLMSLGEYNRLFLSIGASLFVAEHPLLFSIRLSNADKNQFESTKEVA